MARIECAADLGPNLQEGGLSEAEVRCGWQYVSQPPLEHLEREGIDDDGQVGRQAAPSPSLLMSVPAGP
jgi:hypothetical protein